MKWCSWRKLCFALSIERDELREPEHDMVAGDDRDGEREREHHWLLSGLAGGAGAGAGAPGDAPPSRPLAKKPLVLGGAMITEILSPSLSARGSSGSGAGSWPGALLRAPSARSGP